MSILYEIRKRGRYAVLPVICALGTTYFGYHMVHGEYGLLAYWRLTKEIQSLSGERDQVLAQRKASEHLCGLALWTATCWMSGQERPWAMPMPRIW